MLFELLYTSLSTWEMNAEDLVLLLEQSRRKNTLLDVTGLLVYRDRQFMQLIEGEKDVVLSLWETIQSDKRHLSARTIYEDEIEERGFASWSMGFHQLTDVNLKELEGFSSILEQGFTSECFANNPSVARKLMEIIGECFFK